MSIALYNAISGLNNFQKVLDVVGNNLANMSTPGYKRSSVAFKELFSQTMNTATGPGGGLGGINPVQFGLGSAIGSINTHYTQGMLQPTGRPTDLAVSGNGFFIIGKGNDLFYTRNGNFAIDVDGRLVNDMGYTVKGWMAEGGNVNTAVEPGPIRISLGGDSIAKPTSHMRFNGNLDASQELYDEGPPETGGKFVIDTIAYDSLGRSHTLTMTFTKVDSGDPEKSQWNWTGTIDGDDVGTGEIVYDVNGVFDAANSTIDPKIEYTPGEGADDMTVIFDFSQSTQVATPGEYSLIVGNQDGFRAGTLDSFAIDQNGQIVGSFNNGMNQVLGQLALADFVNPEGLEKGEGGILRETANSGAPQIGTPSTGSRGVISSGTLELSNVDMSSEFTNMIIAQRAFQANSRVVSVVDEMLQEMANLKR